MREQAVRGQKAEDGAEGADQGTGKAGKADDRLTRRSSGRKTAMNNNAKCGIAVFEQASGNAIDEMLQTWHDDHPDMGVLALAAEKERETCIETLQKRCAVRGIPLRGGVFPALIDQDRFLDHGCVLLRLDSMPFAEIYAPLQPFDQTAERLIDGLADDVAHTIRRPRESTLFLVFDAMVARIASILDKLYLTLADRVHYMGVNAGSETFRPLPCLFDNERVMQDGVLALLLPSYPGAVVEHCYHAPKRLVSATATSGNRIITIDWRPAFDVYREAAREEYGIEIDRDNFYRIAVHFPFGILRANGEIVVRIPVALEADGSIFCVGEVPLDAPLTLMRAPEVDSRQTVEKLAQGLNAMYGTLSGAGLLTFYCAGRRLHLGDGARSELAELYTHTRSARQAGALSLGEIGHSMQWGYPFFHNGALVCGRWGST